MAGERIIRFAQDAQEERNAQQEPCGGLRPQRPQNNGGGCNQQAPQQHNTPEGEDEDTQE